MFPLYDDKNRKIIFWSFKCGCTFIRHIFYNLYLKLNYKKDWIKIITLLNRYNKTDKQKLLEYRKIYVCRNPYSRIVSCFIDKYINGHFSFYFNLNIKIKNIINYLLSDSYIKPTFKEFINLVYEKFVLSRYTLLEFDHLTPQFSINYTNFKFDKIYKLEDLDNSKFLEDEFDIYDKNQDKGQDKSQDKSHKDNHNNNCSNSEYIINNAFDLDYKKLLELKKSKKIPNYTCFYNDDIKKKVYEIYKTDFINLLEYEIKYNI